MEFKNNIIIIISLVVASIIGIRFILFDNKSQVVEITSGTSGQLGIASAKLKAKNIIPDNIRNRINSSIQTTLPWDGPVTGPVAQSNKSIIYFADDLRNAGILTVGESVRQAAETIGWNVIFIDAQGTPQGRTKAFKRILKAKPDGVIIGGADAFANLNNLYLLQNKGIKIVGWHVSTKPGQVKGTPIITNVMSDNQEVAEIAAYYATLASVESVGTVIFTDSRYKIAMDKANKMKKVIENCSHCEVLSFEDVSLSQTDKLIPVVVERLLKNYGKRWTHSLAINDLYFDYMAPILATKGLPFVENISNISAGDGSSSAFQRIQIGSYQSATVAEPLRFQGWQLIDELNRIFAGESISGYINPVHLVVKENIAFDGGIDNLYDPDNGYRDIYRSIWENGTSIDKEVNEK